MSEQESGDEGPSVVRITPKHAAHISSEPATGITFLWEHFGTSNSMFCVFLRFPILKALLDLLGTFPLRAVSVSCVLRRDAGWPLSCG